MSDPANPRHIGEPKQNPLLWDASWAARRAWLAIPLFLLAIIVFWKVEGGVSFESPSLLIGLNFFFSVLASLSVAFLLGRSFLVKARPGLLLVGCGTLAWGLAGFVGSIAALSKEASGFSANTLVSIHNAGVWLSALLHLLGTAFALRWSCSFKSPRFWLAFAYFVTLGLIGFVSFAACSDWMPQFFAEGRGGTPLRQFVLGCTIAMFLLTVLILRAMNQPRWSAFAYWYALGLGLLAVGLLGVLLQRQTGSLVGWTGRLAQYLGSVYMLVAALASVSEQGIRGIRLGRSVRETHHPFAIAIALVATAAILRLVFLQALGLRVAFVTFYPAVMVAALYGGLRAGLLAALLSALLANYFWMEPTGQFSISHPGDWLAITVFLFSCTMISMITSAMQRAQARAIRAEALAARARLDPDLAELALQHRERRLATEQLRAVFPVNAVFGFALLMLAVLTWSAYQHISATLAFDQWEEQTHQRIHSLHQLRISLAEAEADVNTYLVGVDPGFLDAYAKATGQVWAQWASIQALDDQDSWKQKPLQNLAKPLQAMLGELDDAIKLRQSADQSLVNPLASNGRLERMAAIQAQIAQFQDDALLVLQQHSAEKNQAATAAIRDGRFGVFFSLSLLLLVFLALRREIGERVATEQALERHRDMLELVVNARTEDLEEEISRHRAAIRALQESEERMRLVLRASSMGTFEVDLSSGEGRWNDLEFQLLGLVPGALISGPDTFFQFVHPDDKAMVAANWQEALNTGLLDIEFRIQRANGEIRWLAGRGSFASGGEDGDAPPQRFLGVNFDITERKRAEERLQQSEAALAKAQTIANLGSWEWEISSGEVRWSEQMFRIFDAEPHAFLPSYQDFLSRICPEDRPRVEAKTNESLAQGKSYSVEFRLPSRDGKLHTILSHAEVELSGNGQIVRVFGTCLDITERKEAEAARSLLAAIVESSQDAIIGKDLDGRVASWNQAAEDLFGYTAAEMLGQTLDILFPPNRYAEEKQILQRAAQGEAVSRYETERLRKDGSQIVVSITISPVKDNSGKFIGVSKIARDITARRRTEEERDQYIALVKTSTDFIGMSDLQGNTFFLNDAGMKLIGLDGKEQLARFTVRDYFFPEDQAFIVEEFLPSTLQGPAEVEIRFRHFKTGEAIWMIYSVFALRDRVGMPTGFATVSRNINDRKHMEQALLASEQFKQGVLDSLPAHIAVLDTDGTLLAVNQPWLRFASVNGYAGSEGLAVGANYLEVCRRSIENGEMVAQAVLEGLEAVLADEMSHFELEYPCRLPTTTRWYIVHVLRPPVDIGGAIVSHVDITERKLAEEALRETQRQNEFLANLLENSSQPFGVRYPNRRIGLNNKAFQTLVGYSAEELENLDRATDLTPEEWWPVENQHLEKLDRTGEPVRYEKEYRRKDGHRVPVELLSNAVKDNAGKTLYYYSFVTDISERKQAETALRQERLFLRQVIDAVPSLIFVKDIEGRILLCNEAFACDYNASVEELVGKSNVEINQHPEEVNQFYQDDLEVIRTGLAKILDEEKATLGDGSAHWFSTAKMPMYNSDGVCDRVLGVATDITARKEAEEALRHSQADLKRAQAVAHTGSWRMDVRHNVLSWSDETYRIFGIPRGTPLTYEAFLAHVHADDQERLDNAWQAALAGNPYDIEHRIIVDGQVKWLRERAEIEFDELGILLGGFGTAQDISELKASQQALQEADRRKDEFLAMLAHELRNPLTPIMVAAQMLQKRGAEDPALVKWAGSTVKHQCENLTQLVNQLLDVSRVTKGKITLKKMPVDLRNLLGKAVESCRHFIDQHGHELSVTLSEEPMLADVDAVRIEQVLGNLLNNATKYTPADGKIWLSLEREEDTAIIRVRDSGIGISAAMLPSIFDLFVQAERALDRAQGGLGIGLALVKSLVEMHGGSVKASSAGIGSGSEFEVRLPLLAQAHPPLEAPPEASTQALAKTRRRILVVDDNDDVRISMALLLRAMGHEVWEAGGGQQALEMKGLAKWDAILLDIGMPGLNGYEVARLMREDPALSSVTLIAVTGYSQEADRQASLQAGFDHHLAKPLNPAELSELLMG